MRCCTAQAHLFAYNAPTQLPRPAKMTSEDSQERSERGESMYAHKLQYSLDDKGVRFRHSSFRCVSLAAPLLGVSTGLQRLRCCAA